MSMDGTTAFAPAPEPRLSVVLAEYLEAVDRGEKPDRESLLLRYPTLAAALRAFFADQDRFDALALPLRDAGKEEAEELAYDLLEEINRGGMGVVLRGRDRVLNRSLAIKVLLDRFRDNPDMVRRFIDEARITGRLQHPFIVPVHKLGTLPDGRPYFAMKLVEGRTLSDLLDARTSPDQDRSRFLKVFEQICQTIAFAHSRGVIHRDLKPSNVMVGAFGEVQVMDWGLAKMLLDCGPNQENPPSGDEAGHRDTQAGAVLGTYAYMPPEQARGELEKVNRRSDVFGLGAILCEILTGSPPYRGESSQVARQARSSSTQDALARLETCGADGELTQLARACLVIDPAERPEDGAAVAEAMANYFALVQERMRNAEIARARAETEAVEERKRLQLAEAKALAEEKRHRAERRRRRATLLLAASLLLLVTLGAGFGLWVQLDRSRQAGELATRRGNTERDVAAALAEVHLRLEEGLKQADHPVRWKASLVSACDALKRAENAVALGEASDDLQTRVTEARQLLEQDERDHQLFATMERLHMDAASLSPEDVRAPRDATAFLKAFRDYGLDLEALAPEEAAARITRHRHRERLLDEINIVAQVQADYGSKRTKQAQAGFSGVLIAPTDWKKAEQLCRILDEADPNPDSFGRRWRTARAARDAKALIELAKLPEARKSSPRGSTSLSHDLISVRAIAEAKALLVQAHDQHPTDFWLNQVLGVVAFADTLTQPGSSGQDALRYLTAALAVRGNNSATHLVMSNVYRAQGKMEEALRSGQAAIAADPDSAPAHYNVGNIHHAQGRLDEALACYHKTADLDSRSNLPFDALGQSYAAKKDHALAILHYQIAQARDPEFPHTYVNLANSLMETGELDEAIRTYDQALELFPGYALAHNNRAQALIQKKDFAAAEKSYRDAIASDPDYTLPRYGLGTLLLLFKRDVPRAIQCYQGVIDRHPNQASAYFQMADLLMGLGQMSQAEGHLRKVMELDNRFPEVQARLGMTLLARGASDEAISLFRQGLKLEKLSREHRSLLLDQLGLGLFNKGDLKGALEKHQEALELDHRNGIVPHNLGVVYLALGNLELAAAAFEKAIKHNPRNALFHVRLAKARIELRELDGAIASAREAIRLAPTHPEAHVALATAHVEKFEFARGLEVLRQARDRLPPVDPGHGLLLTTHQFAENMIKADAVVAAVLRGEQAAETLPKGVLAYLMANKHGRYMTAVRLHQESFAEQPKLTENLVGGQRVNAARAAVRVANGDDPEARLDKFERDRMRRQALSWLTAELESWKRAVRVMLVPAEQGTGRFLVRRWLKEPDFQSVREEASLKKIPPLERDEWLRLWADAAAFADGKTIEGPNLARLKRLLPFPSVYIFLDVKYNGDERDGAGNPIDLVKKTDQLQSKLTGTTKDAEALLELACTHSLRDDPKKARDLAEKAFQYLEPIRKTNDAADSTRLMLYARALGTFRPEQWQECEAAVRRAVELNPRDWKAWQSLAHYGMLHAEKVLLDEAGLKERTSRAAFKVLEAGKASPATLEKVEKRMEEARAAQDKARALAPDSEEQWQTRIAHLLNEVEWINAVRVARGKPPLPRQSEPLHPTFVERGFEPGRFSLEMLPDLLSEFREAAERCPNHVGIQFFGMSPLLAQMRLRVKDHDPIRDRGKPFLTKSELQFAEQTLARIEKTAARATPEGALYCERLLAYLRLQLAVLDDMKVSLLRAERHLKRVFEENPTDSDAADMLEFVLVEQGRMEAALEVGRKRFEADPRPRHRYMLVRLLAKCGQEETAQKELHALLKTDPDDPHALGAQALFLMRKGGKEDLDEAGKLLSRARGLIRPDHNQGLTADLEFLTGIHHALSGRDVLARLTLDSLRPTYSRPGDLAEAMEALGTSP